MFLSHMYASRETPTRLTFPLEQFPLTARGIWRRSQVCRCSGGRIRADTRSEARCAQVVSRGGGHFLREVAQQNLQLLFARVFVIQAGTGVTEECNLPERRKQRGWVGGGELAIKPASMYSSVHSAPAQTCLHTHTCARTHTLIIWNSSVGRRQQKEQKRSDKPHLILKMYQTFTEQTQQALVQRHLFTRSTNTQQLISPLKDHCNHHFQPHKITHDFITSAIITNFFTPTNGAVICTIYTHTESIRLVKSTHQLSNIRGRHEHGGAHGEVWRRQTRG